MIACYNPYAVDFLRGAFSKSIRTAPKTPERIFIRRTSYGRNMINEDEVLDFLREEGFAIIDTAALSFEQQIQHFAGAQVVAGIHGSGLNNIVFSPPGCKIFELFADCYMCGGNEWISQCINADYHPLVFPSDYKIDAQVDLDRLRRALRKTGAI
jgi:capsular polysaccharide biosynthesis protein